MLNGQKIVVVMPAYNAARTLQRTYDEVMQQGIVDLVIVVDDASHDETAVIAKRLPNTIVYTHQKNRGYGGNQKTCYKLALEAGADIVIMVHPDYQYTPKLIPAMATIIANDLHPCVLGSRILGGYALKGGMPLWRYISNRFLTLAENLFQPAQDDRSNRHAYQGRDVGRLVPDGSRPVEIGQARFEGPVQVLVVGAQQGVRRKQVG